MMRAPQRVTQAGMPEQVTIYEVGAGHGLQNEQRSVDTRVKAEFIARLADAGFGVIEATSMVHPQWVPQLADAEQLLARLDFGSETRYPVLVPNEHGLDRALASGAARSPCLPARPRHSPSAT
jgi:hydroxymethylglutaryl-CoA lyase